MRHLCSILALCLILSRATIAEEKTGFRAGFAEARGTQALIIEAGEERLAIWTDEWSEISPTRGKGAPRTAGDAYNAALAAMAPVEVRFGRTSLRGLIRSTSGPSDPVDEALFVLQFSGGSKDILVLGLSAKLGKRDLAVLRKGLEEGRELLVYHGAAIDLEPAKADGSFGADVARRTLRAIESARTLSPLLRFTDTGLPVLGDVGLLWTHEDYTFRCLEQRRKVALRHGLADIVLMGHSFTQSRDLKGGLPPRWPPNVSIESLAPVGLRAKYRIDRVWLDSEKPSGHPTNDHFPVEHYVPPDEAKGAIIVLPIWRGGVLLAERIVAAHLAERGYQAAIMPLPWQFQRAAEGVGSGAWTVSSDLERTQRAIVQALSDVGTLTDWLKSRRDARHRVGILGISLGAHVAAGAYRMDPRLRAGVFVMAGGDPASMIWAASKETRGIKRDLVARGVTLEQAREILSPLDPAKAGGEWPFPGFPRYRGALMINGTEDTVIPPENARILHTALGEPEILWLPVNHYSMATRIKEVLDRTVKHLDSLFE